ncbi:hypothetical protein BX661DRAFT_178907 [Kickxella alabastrina]|uniref:uncharacterized protein n=1 Tax=Kickxella alabastrina TaxID=61397 RepID=UPI002220782C|nr:uncharacterized protein BX661DRAFT_178907 [Kickxella alabastrina]KAI7832981.1 hypothetical protein BX661DRAFT_178907 [Kickxella alabastrina]
MPFATSTYASPRRQATLRDSREFAQLCHFLHLFHPSLKLHSAPDLDQLHTELLTTPADPSPTPALLTHILIRSLRTLTGNRNIDEHNLDAHVQRAWEKFTGRVPEKYAQGIFQIGAARERAGMVLETCELVLCKPEMVRGKATETAEEGKWRVEPLGVDALGRIYWVLCGSQLYRETPRDIADLLLGTNEQGLVEAREPHRRRTSMRKYTVSSAALDVSAEALELADLPRHGVRESDGDLWELLCETPVEWTTVAARLFCRSKHPGERALHKLLAEMAPDIAHRLALDARRKHARSVAAAAVAGADAMGVRKRSSRIAVRESIEDAKAMAEGAGRRRLREEETGEEEAVEVGRRERAWRREAARRSALDDAEIALAIRSSGNADGAAAVETTNAEPEPEPGPETRPEPGPELKPEPELKSEPMPKPRPQPDMHMEMEMDEDDWMFRCSCGKSGHNYDDGRAMTACEKCNVWRHLGCALRAEAQRIGRDIDEDDWETVRYVCPECRKSRVNAQT